MCRCKWRRVGEQELGEGLGKWIDEKLGRESGEVDYGRGIGEGDWRRGIGEGIGEE